MPLFPDFKTLNQYFSDHQRRQVFSIVIPGIGDAGDARRVEAVALPVRPTGQESKSQHFIMGPLS
jgi:hypothetical protein